MFSKFCPSYQPRSFSFVFWKNRKQEKNLLRLTDLYWWCLFLVVDVFLVHFRSPSNDSEGNVFLSWVAKSNGLRGRLVLQGFCLYIHKVWRSSLLTCRPFDGHYQSQQRSLTTVTLHWPALVCLQPATISQRSCNPSMGWSRKGGGRYQNWDYWSCKDTIRYDYTNKSWLVC